MRLLSWNLDGLDDRYLDERSEAACLRMLLRDPPDVVCLQEVVDRSWHAHLKPHFGHAGYSAVLQPSQSEYYCAILSRLPLTDAVVLPFPATAMGRALLSVRIGSWLVCTAHLESMRSGASARVAQAHAISEHLLGHPGPAVFAGDTNLRESEFRLPSEIHDAWEACGGASEHRYTWDLRRNPNKASRGAKPRLRFDQIWVKGARVHDFSLLGTERLAQGVCASDHFGLVSRLSIPEAPSSSET